MLVNHKGSLSELSMHLVWISKGDNSVISVIPDRLLPANCKVGKILDNSTMYIPEYVTPLKDDISNIEHENTPKYVGVAFDALDEIEEITFAEDKHMVKSHDGCYFIMPPAEKRNRIVYLGVVGEIDFEIKIKSSSESIVVKLCIVPKNIEEYELIVADLIEITGSLRDSLLYNQASPVTITNSQKGSGRKITSEKESNTKEPQKNKAITTPEDTLKFLTGFEIKIRNLQNHSETDLESVVEKTPLRKVKRFTPKTIIEYRRGTPKVSAIAYREHLNLYEHRMIKNYLEQMREECRFRVVKCDNDIFLDKTNKERITNNNRFYKSISQKNASSLQSTDTDPASKELKIGWKKCIDKIDYILEHYAVLNVPSTSETLHSTMLFLRNKYYSSVFEDLNRFRLMKVYSKYDSLPAERQWKLYESWCFYKMLDFIKKVYGFNIVYCSKDINEVSYYFNTPSKIEESSINVDDVMDSVPILDRGRMYSIGYIGYILKKQWTPRMRVYSGENESPVWTEERTKTAYIRLEYQRTFCDKQGKIDIIPDICMTTALTANGESERQMYIFDAKYKHFKTDKDKGKYNPHYKWIHELFYVAWYKYLSYFYNDKTGSYEFKDKESRNKIRVMGSFILFPEDFGVKGIDKTYIEPFSIGEIPFTSGKFEPYTQEEDKGKYNPNMLFGKRLILNRWHSKKTLSYRDRILCRTEEVFDEETGTVILRDVRNPYSCKLEQYYYPLYGWTNEYYGRNLGSLFLYHKDNCTEKELDKLKTLSGWNDKLKKIGNDISEQEKKDKEWETYKAYFNGVEDKNHDKWGMRNKLGLFYYSPIYDYGMRYLLRMILELNRPFDFYEENYNKKEDTYLPILWNTCKICGKEFEDGDIKIINNTTDDETESVYNQYQIRCSRCKDTWNKTHCNYYSCKNTLIRHPFQHNYLFNLSFKYVKCPECGN